MAVKKCKTCDYKCDIPEESIIKCKNDDSPKFNTIIKDKDSCEFHNLDCGHCTLYKGECRNSESSNYGQIMHEYDVCNEFQGE